jgi:hypothetical protein
VPKTSTWAVCHPWPVLERDVTAVEQEIHRLMPSVRPSKQMDEYVPDAGHWIAASLTYSGSVPESRLEQLSRALTSLVGLTLDGSEYFVDGPYVFPIFAEDFARPVLAYAKRFSPHLAMEQWLRVFETGLRGEHVTALWGVHPDAPVELHPGVTLLPLTDLSPSPQRDTFLGRVISTQRSPLLTEAVSAQPKPTAALSRPFCATSTIQGTIVIASRIEFSGNCLDASS